METSNSNGEHDGKDNQNVVADGKKPLRGKSCKGCLFYSSVINSKSQSPFCFGQSHTLQQVPDYVVNSDAKVAKGNQTLTDFRYTCIGYSVHLENNIQSSEPEKQLVKLPFCVGIEILSSKGASKPDPVPASLRTGKDGHTSTHPQPEYHPQLRQPIQAPNGFVYSLVLQNYRFTRNAGVVAMGVKRNILRVSSHIKKKMDNALDPYRRRSK
ncbi:hypothetical protein M9H77_13577 [Catharanthus roseus]|uniref:Uncharacterized protein n=1 Tax=Catharanthus roseus TaxID=4058 RepID=A0ACC0BKT8_CATRO|nr:hypothetical protein M9H77_13577 [Catharanthus roseus]